MAVYTVQGSKNIPPGAVKISEEEAYIHQKNFVRDWPKELDVLFLRYSYLMAGGITLVSSLFSWTHYRPYLGLRTKGRFLMFIPCSLIPTCITGLTYQKQITKNVLIMKNECPLCWQLLYSFTQVFNGVLYPATLGLIGGIAFAGLYNTYPTPSSNPRELYKIFYSLTKPGFLKFQILITLNLLSSLMLPYFQNKELAALIVKANNLNKTEDLLE